MGCVYKILHLRDFLAIHEMVPFCLRLNNYSFATSDERVGNVDHNGWCGSPIGVVHDQFVRQATNFEFLSGKMATFIWL